MAFIEKLSDLPVPEVIKNPKNVKIDVSDGDKENIESLEVESEAMVVEETKKKKVQIFFDKAKDTLAQGAGAVGKASIKVAAKTEDLLRDKNVVTRQMLFYGVVNLYNSGLEEFMNA